MQDPELKDAVQEPQQRQLPANGDSSAAVSDAPQFSTPGSFLTATYFFADFATASSPATKSAALLNSMISQATGAFLSIIMV